MLLLWVKGFTKKNGFVKGVQLYKCGNCGRQFLGGNRLNNENI
jgi:transposase-like protein